MTKKLTTTTICLLSALMLLGLFTATPTSAISYTNSKGSVKVKCGSYSHTFNAKNYGKNFSRTLNYALYIASRKATSKKPATVKVAKGNYKIDRTIYIYSNTTLVATGSNFTRRDNIISNGYDKSASSAKGYSGAKNITVKGGVWDIAVPYSQANTTNTSVMHSTFRFGHCTNVKVIGCTFKNNYNCHDIELGGVDTAVIKDCVFSNDKNVNKFTSDGGKEAVQIDLNTQAAVPYFPAYDYTTCKNITVKNNSFKNKYRAVGSHHAMVGATYDNISVYNNTFDNIAGFTVYAVYWTNSKIYGNKFTNVGCGIDIRPMIIGDSMNFYNYKKLSYLDSKYVAKNSKTYVYDNTISVRKNDNAYDSPFGIRVWGAFLEEKDSATGINTGEYDAYNVNIGVNSSGNSKPNIIKGNLGYGIYMAFANKCSIKNNNIDLSDSQTSSSYGVVVKGGTKTDVSNNTITNGTKEASRGVYVGAASGIPSESTAVSDNIIDSFTYSGVFVTDSTDTVFSGNTLTNSEYGAAIKASVNTAFMNNSISGCSSYGVYSSAGSTGTSITGNNIASKSSGFFLNDSKDPYPSEEKTLQINGNTMNITDEVAPITLKYSNLAARIYNNTAGDGGYADCRIKGVEDMKYTYCFGDFALKSLSAERADEGINLSWSSPEDISGYRIYRTIYGEDTYTLCDISESCYRDTDYMKYMSDSGVSYSACPYISSGAIKLLGEATPFITVN